MAQDPVLDKTGSNNTQATIGLKKLNRMKEEFSLVDTWRSTNKNQSNIRGMIKDKLYKRV